MRTSLDQMIDLANVFTSYVLVGKSTDGKITAHIQRVSWKENRHSSVKTSIFGTGESIYSACDDFLNKARGKLLIGDDPAYYGENRPEYICV